MNLEQLLSKFKKKISSYDDAQALSKRLKLTMIGSVVAVVLVFIISGALSYEAREALLGIFSAVALIGIALFIYSFMINKHVAKAMNKLSGLKCEGCGHYFCETDEHSVFIGQKKTTTAVSKTKVRTNEIKSELQDEAPETLAARKYIGEDIYETKTKTTMTTTSTVDLTLTFVCPKCGKHHSITKPDVSATNHTPTKEEAEKHFLEGLFPSYLVF